MKCEVIVIKNLIKQNKLDLAIQELMDYADKTGANNIVVNHYWSQQKLQQLIEEQCKDEYSIGLPSMIQFPILKL